MQEQDGEHSALLCSAECEGALARLRFERAENPELDRSRVDDRSRLL